MWLGLSPKIIKDIENGYHKTKPSAGSIEKLAKGLKVTSAILVPEATKVPKEVLFRAREFRMTGSIVRYIRDQFYGWSQAALARRARVSLKQLEALENNQIILTVQNEEKDVSYNLVGPESTKAEASQLSAEEIMSMKHEIVCESGSYL